MRKYNWDTGEYDEIDVNCDICGKLIDGSRGSRTTYKKDKNGKKVKIEMGSCCAGKIRGDALAKKNRAAYQSQGQIPDSVLRKMPKSPSPLKGRNKDAGKKIHSFIDSVGRSKLTKSEKMKLKIPGKIKPKRGGKK